MAAGQTTANCWKIANISIDGDAKSFFDLANILVFQLNNITAVGGGKSMNVVIKCQQYNSTSVEKRQKSPVLDGNCCHSLHIHSIF